MMQFLAGVIAYSYLRWSTAEQTFGDSERRQLEEARAWAKRNGVTLDESLTPDRGVSGFKGKHRRKGSLGHFLELVEAGEIKRGSILVIENLDRLGREAPAETLREIVFKLWDKGITIITLRPEEVYEPGCSNSPKFVVLILYLQRAHDESLRKSDRVGANWERWRRDVAAGKRLPPPGRLPCWLAWDEDANDFGFNPGPLAAIRRIWEWAGAGIGIVRTLKLLSQEGIPPIGYGDKWAHSYVSNLLNDRTLLGELTLKDGRVISDFFPRVIQEDQWHRTRFDAIARTLGKGRRKGGGRPSPDVRNLLTGILFDARNGQPLHCQRFVNGKPGSSRLCYMTRRVDQDVQWQSIPQRVLENAVLRFVRELKPGSLLNRTSEDEDALRILDGRKAELESNITKAKARCDARSIESILDLLTLWDDELKGVKAEIEVVSGRLAVNDADNLNGAQQLIDAMRAAEGDERAELRERLRSKIRSLVERIDLLVWDVDSVVRAAQVQVTLRDGTVRVILISWATRGKWPGLSVAVGGPVATKGHDAHMADKRLSEYPTNPAVREWASQMQERMKPAILESIAAELKARLTLAEADKATGKNLLGRFLAEATLDGTPMPVRTGRPRKAAAG